ncbi:MAG: copper amine oxidase [Clostridia bacterium]|nr:copper amine oxidase [Clostridia bacterium]
MRRFLCILLAVFCFLGVFSPARAANREEVILYVDGIRVDSSGKSFIKNETVYVPFRELSLALGAIRVRWDGSSGTVSAKNGSTVITAGVGIDYIMVSDRYFYAPDGCFLLGDTLMVPAGQLAKAFGAEVSWDGKGAISIMTGKTAPAPGNTYYSEDDVYWLSRIIYAEARGERLRGKIAVGNVVLNRVKSEQYPDTVREVIFDMRSGVQFTPAATGSVYCTPTEDCIIAAKLALEGASTAGNSLFFATAAISASCWAGRNREFFAKIGNHCFFA